MSRPAFPDLLDFGQSVVYKALEACAGAAGPRHLLAVDATCGNGHDTVFLAQSLRKLHNGKPYAILALDIQEQALRSTRALLEERGLSNEVELLLKSHALLDHEMEQRQCGMEDPLRLAAVMYNLGFLPRSDKRVITRKDSTLASLHTAVRRLAPGGILSVHAYAGHPGGQEELDAVDAWCAALPFDVWIAARYGIHNKPRAPEALFLVQKRMQS